MSIETVLKLGVAASVLLAVVLSWTIFPVVAAVLARVMGLGRNYVPYIVANNWAAALTPQAVARALEEQAAEPHPQEAPELVAEEYEAEQGGHVLHAEDLPDQPAG